MSKYVTLEKSSNVGGKVLVKSSLGLRLIHCRTKVYKVYIKVQIYAWLPKILHYNNFIVDISINNTYIHNTYSTVNVLASS